MHDRLILKCVIEFMDMWYKKLLLDVRVVKDGVVEVCWDTFRHKNWKKTIKYYYKCIQNHVKHLRMELCKNS